MKVKRTYQVIPMKSELPDDDLHKQPNACYTEAGWCEYDQWAKDYRTRGSEHAKRGAIRWAKRQHNLFH
jgi:hypothetical protein